VPLSRRSPNSPSREAIRAPCLLDRRELRAAGARHTRRREFRREIASSIVALFLTGRMRLQTPPLDLVRGPHRPDPIRRSTFYDSASAGSCVGAGGAKSASEKPGQAIVADAGGAHRRRRTCPHGRYTLWCASSKPATCWDGGSESPWGNAGFVGCTPAAPRRTQIDTQIDAGYRGDVSGL
jgi:hypothetical protein